MYVWFPFPVLHWALLLLNIKLIHRSVNSNGHNYWHWDMLNFRTKLFVWWDVELFWYYLHRGPLWADWLLQNVLPKIFTSKRIKCMAGNRNLELGVKCSSFIVLFLKAKPKILLLQKGKTASPDIFRKWEMHRVWLELSFSSWALVKSTG